MAQVETQADIERKIAELEKKLQEMKISSNELLKIREKKFEHVKQKILE